MSFPREFSSNSANIWWGVAHMCICRVYYLGQFCQLLSYCLGHLRVTALAMASWTFPSKADYFFRQESGTALLWQEGTVKITCARRRRLIKFDGSVSFPCIGDPQMYATPTKGFRSKHDLFEGVVYELSEPKNAAKYAPPPWLQLQCSA